MDWMHEADLLDEVERGCEALALRADPLEDLELAGRLMLVAARVDALRVSLKERMQREDGG